ncbi:DUF4810 domain-containing protein [Amantichitinum ursilacus]|uniref:Lipoprotein n=1 Tax=Amantichitinum ursilacus TaxID=857265 RepID=A0A0N0GKZ9_9NEIS|nr:DUF4810 domain-containing protein [Amantichitinum ursilacus]KPC49387.1 hypothetical protein WG78_20870 [Amantichitinum ursilacus]
MSIVKASKAAALCAVAAVSLLSGCAAQQKPLYGWGHYQQNVYSYFKSTDGDTTAQVTELEADLQKMLATGEAVPPGYHAHMGLLYAKSGRMELTQREFETEKKLYPESTAYMDFLLRNFSKKD